MNMLATLIMQLVIVRWAIGLLFPFLIAVGFRYSGDDGLIRSRYRDPDIARASDDWNAAAKRPKTQVMVKSEDVVEAAIAECMETWEQTPLELRAEFNKPAPTEAEAREKLRPVAEARCRRSARYRN